MVFKATSCAKAGRAFTLVEVMLASTIAVVVLAAALMLWAYASRSCATLLNYVELSGKSKHALDSLSQLIRNASTVESCSSSRLDLLDLDGTRITIAYDPALQTLFLTNGTSTRTMLTQCTNFHFYVYQRTPQSNSFDLTPPTIAFDTNTTKVVQMDWACVRKLTGDQDTAENQVSAQIVIRNK